MLLNRIAEVENSPEFKSWKEKDPDSYLTSTFSMFSETPKEWSISYFNPKTKKTTSFSCQGVKKQEEPFSKEKNIPALELDKVKIEEDTALKLAREEFGKKSSASVEKIVMVLQNLKDSPFWNVTFITSDLKSVNLKISCNSEEVLDVKVMNLSDFMQSS